MVSKQDLQEHARDPSPNSDDLIPTDLELNPLEWLMGPLLFVPEFSFSNKAISFR